MSKSSLSADEYLKQLGARVRRERVRRGWRQADLAERVGMSRSRIARIENGALKRVPHLELRALAEALEVGFGYLVLAEDHPVRRLLRATNPRFEQRQLLELATVGLAGRLLYDTLDDPAALEDMAHALVYCAEEPLSRAVVAAWLEKAGKVDSP